MKSIEGAETKPEYLGICLPVVRDAVGQWYEDGSMSYSSYRDKTKAVHMLYDAGITAGVLLEFPELLEEMPFEFVKRLVSGDRYRELDWEQIHKVEEHARSGAKFVSIKMREGRGAVLVPMEEGQFFLARMNGKQLGRDGGIWYEFDEHGPGTGVVNIDHSAFKHVRKTRAAQEMTKAHATHRSEWGRKEREKITAEVRAAWDATRNGVVIE